MFEHPGQAMIKASRTVFWIMIALGLIELIVGLAMPYVSYNMTDIGVGLMVSAYFVGLFMTTVGKICVDLEETKKQNAEILEAIKRQNAGTQNAPPDTCSGCGAKLAPGTSFCPQCGKKIR